MIHPLATARFGVWLLCCLTLLLVACGTSPEATPTTSIGIDPNVSTAIVNDYALVIHGGAGVIERSRMSEEYEAGVRQVLAKAVAIGQTALSEGAKAEDVVVEVVSYLENQPQFNAGKGAVFTYEGINELDASLMRGQDLQAGAVSGVRGVKHPIQLAQRVMTSSEHVMLSGQGAREFAEEQALEIMPMDYFSTPRRYESWQKARARADAKPSLSEDGKFGTVGCVVRDKKGNLAAGTSTGGMTLKRYGRIGDSPIIGAGTYADNATCAISATGHGEYFIRYAVAHEISSRMKHGGQSLEESAGAVIMQDLAAIGGDGGIIGVDAKGRIAMPFNTPGMYRGFATPDTTWVAIYGDEKF